MTAEHPRPFGWYWVRERPDYDWEPAHYDAYGWLIAGHQARYPDSTWSEIGEPLTPPAQDTSNTPPKENHS